MHRTRITGTLLARARSPRARRLLGSGLVALFLAALPLVPLDAQEASPIDVQPTSGRAGDEIAVKSRPELPCPNAQQQDEPYVLVEMLPSQPGAETEPVEEAEFEVIQGAWSGELSVPDEEDAPAGEYHLKVSCFSAADDEVPSHTYQPPVRFTVLAQSSPPSPSPPPREQVPSPGPSLPSVTTPTSPRVGISEGPGARQPSKPALGPNQLQRPGVPSVSTPPNKRVGDQLARTGSGGLPVLLLIAAVLIGTGGLLMLVRGRARSVGRGTAKQRTASQMPASSRH